MHKVAENGGGSENHLMSGIGFIPDPCILRLSLLSCESSHSCHVINVIMSLPFTIYTGQNRYKNGLLYQPFICLAMY